MGLDMYLTKKRYVKNWEHDTKNDWHLVLTNNGEEVKEESPIYEVVYEAGYWRKANHIHAWFVDNCGGGVDECQPMYVDVEQLQELREKCVEVLKTADVARGKVLTGYSFKNGVKEPMYEDGLVVTNPEEVAKVLPTSEGFFFGSTEYDQWYLRDCEDTINIINRALRGSLDNCEFEYRASW